MNQIMSKAIIPESKSDARCIIYKDLLCKKSLINGNTFTKIKFYKLNFFIKKSLKVRFFKQIRITI